MGIRRRRKRINTILSQIDRRLKSVELRRAPRIIRDGTITKRQLSVELQASLETSEAASTANPGSVAPAFTAQPYVDIVKIVYAGYSAASDRDRARVYFTTDPGIDVGDRIRFASTRSAFDNPSKTAPYTVLETGVVDGYSTIVYAPGWNKTLTAAQVTYDKGVRIQWPNVSLAGTIIDGSVTRYTKGQIKYFTEGNAAAGFASRDDYLNGPRYPDSIETTQGSHVADWTYDIGDLINLNGLGANFDGVHKITSKTVSGDGLEITLQFDFKTVLTAPVTMPSSNGSLRPAAGRFLRNGETYTDTSVTPAITYVWDDNLQRWWNIADPLLPENLLIDDGIAPAAPTSLGGTSTGYVSGTVPRSRVILNWTAPTKNADNTNLTDFLQYRVYYKYAETSGGFVEITQTKLTTATIIDLPPQKDFTFVVTAEDKVGNESVYSAEFNITTSQGSLALDIPSIPLVTTKFGTITVTWDGKNFLGADLSGSATLAGVEVHRSTTSGFTAGPTTLTDSIFRPNTFTVDTNVEYSTTYYYKLIAFDYSGNKTAASAQASAVPKALVDTDMIASTLTYWPFVGEVVSASALASGAVSASKLAQNAINSSNFANVIQANALTSDVIAAGAIGADEIAAGAVIAGKIGADAVTATTIAAESITTGKIKANAINADKIDVGAISGVLIRGDTIATALSGARVELTRDGIFAYNSNASDLPIFSFGTANSQLNIRGSGTTISLNDGAFSMVSGNGAVSGIPLTTIGTSFRASGTQVGFISLYQGEDGIIVGRNGSHNIALFGSDSQSFTSISNGQLGGSVSLTATNSGQVRLQSNMTRILNSARVELFALGNTFDVLNNTSSDNAGRMFRVTQTGTTLIGFPGNAATDLSLYVFGKIQASGTFTGDQAPPSSRRMKTDIREFSVPDSLFDISPKVFKYINAIRYENWQEKPNVGELSEDSLGVIAEEFAEIGLDYLVSRSDQGVIEGLEYSKIGVLLLPAIKDLRSRVTQLEERLNELDI